MASPRSKPAHTNKKGAARKPTAARRKRAPNQAGALSASALQISFDTAPVVTFSYRYTDNVTHGFTEISAHAKILLGMKAAELLKSAGGLRLHPDDVETFQSSVLGAMAKAAPVDAHLRVLHSASAARWVHINAWLTSTDKKSKIYSGLILDINARKKTEADTVGVLARMEQAQVIAKLGWYDNNLKDRVIDLTSDFADDLGLPFAPGGRVTGAAADRYREAFLNAVHPEDRERYVAIISDPTWRRTEFDYRVLTRANEVRHLCSRILRTADKNGKRIRDFCVVLDITERKRLEEDLRAQAATDPLTGVANRRSFETTSRREVERARRYAKPFAVIVLDIDHFKKVNDTYGHDVGDFVLKGLTAIILEKLRVTDVLARLGGEEFAVLLPETDIDAAASLAERLRYAVAHSPVATAKGPLTITVSLGVAQHALNEPAIDAAFKRADEALYEAKHSGRNKVVVAKLPSLVRSAV